MKKQTRLAIISLSLLGLIASSYAPAVQAVRQTTPNSNDSGQALEIAPPVLTLSANPGDTVKAQISLRDVSPTKLLVEGQVNDFIAAGEDGTPKILMENDESSPYSLKPWIAPLSKLTLKPREIKELPVTIKVPKDAAPGGYYAVIRFTATPPELEGTGVALSASLGSLVLLRVNGPVREGMTIEEFSVNYGGKTGTMFQSTPLQFVQRIKNTGSVHEQPAGQVTIKDMFGKVVAAVNINLPPRNILPGSIRKFEQPLDSSVIGNKMLFGRYTADLKVNYGTEKSITSTLTFWVIPYSLIGIGIAGLVATFFVLRFAIKRYNQSIITKAQGASKKKK